jgi:hypothetical protein
MTDEQQLAFFEKYFMPALNMVRDELKSEVSGLRDETKAGLSSLRAEMNVRFDAVKEDIQASEARIVTASNQQNEKTVEILDQHDKRITRIENARTFPFAN